MEQDICIYKNFRIYDDFVASSEYQRWHEKFFLALDITCQITTWRESDRIEISSPDGEITINLQEVRKREDISRWLCLFVSNSVFHRGVFDSWWAKSVHHRSDYIPQDTLYSVAHMLLVKHVSELHVFAPFMEIIDRVYQQITLYPRSSVDRAPAS